MAGYFGSAPPSDAAWAVHFLSGRRPKRLVGGRKLYMWAAEIAGIPDWLFEESYHAVGDLAETIAMVLPAPTRASPLPLHEWVEQTLMPLRGADERDQRETLRR